MPEFKIEKNVPMPETRGAKASYPFADMEPGDSIFLPCDSIRDNHNAQSAAGVYGRRHGRKYATRTVEGGLRVWRIDGMGDQPTAQAAE